MDDRHGGQIEEISRQMLSFSERLAQIEQLLESAGQLKAGG
jgi:hypothetical protein